MDVTNRVLDIYSYLRCLERDHKGQMQVVNLKEYEIVPAVVPSR
jgi:hypothetical protein